MLLGIAWRSFVGVPGTVRPGIVFVMKPLLRFAIVLLGLQITLVEVSGLGLRGAIAVAGTLGATFAFTKMLGRALGVEQRLAELIAAGTSVCGASAVIACNTVTRGSDEDVAYAIACVTLFGTTAMLVLPILAGAGSMAPETYGLWAGATIHEVAQVIGAAFALGDEAGHAGTVAKLTRVMLLAPLVLSLGVLRARESGSAGRAPIPWFVFGFLALMLLNSVVSLPEPVTAAVSTATAFMLTAALGAMGLETDLRKLRLKGFRPLALGAAAWLFIAVLGLLGAYWATGM